MATGIIDDMSRPTVQRVAVFRDDADRKRHLVAITKLSEEMDLPFEQVCSCYEAVLNEMRSKARIEDFLDIFVVRRARERLRAYAH